MKKNSQLQDLFKKYSTRDKFDKNSFIAEIYNLLLETKWAKEAKEAVRKRQHSEYYLNECSNIEDGGYKQEFALSVKLMTITETCLKLDHQSDDSSYFLEFMLGLLDDECADASELIVRYDNLMSTLQAFQIKKHFKSQLYKTLERSKHLDIVFSRKRNSTRLLEQIIDDWEKAEIKVKASITSSQEATIKGFNTSLQPEQIESLCSQMKGDYIDCTLDDFKAMFSDSPKPLKWIDKSPKRNQPNKKTIFEFIYLLKEYGYIKKIELNTTATEPNNLYRKLELLFPDMNNFPESNVSGKAEKNTPRKKKLEDIIKSI